MSEIDIVEESDRHVVFRDEGKLYVRFSLGSRRFVHNLLAPEIFRKLLSAGDVARLKTLKLVELGDVENVAVFEVSDEETAAKLREEFHRAILESSLSNPGVLLQIENFEFTRFVAPRGAMERQRMQPPTRAKEKGEEKAC